MSTQCTLSVCMIFSISNIQQSLKSTNNSWKSSILVSLLQTNTQLLMLPLQNFNTSSITSTYLCYLCFYYAFYTFYAFYAFYPKYNCIAIPSMVLLLNLIELTQLTQNQFFALNMVGLGLDVLIRIGKDTRLMDASVNSPFKMMVEHEAILVTMYFYRLTDRILLAMNSYQQMFLRESLMMALSIRKVNLTFFLGLGLVGVIYDFGGGPGVHKDLKKMDTLLKKDLLCFLSCEACISVDLQCAINISTWIISLILILIIILINYWIHIHNIFHYEQCYPEN